MRHIKQRLQNDCGTAAAAMAARVSYVRAKQLTPNYVNNKGLTAAKMCDILSRLSRKTWKRIELTGKLPRLDGFYQDGEAVLMIWNPYKKKGLKGHYAFIRNGFYYDPDLPYPIKLRSPKLRKWKHWQVCQIITKG